MRRWIGAVALLFLAAEGRAADPVYIDELMESPLATLQQRFPTLKREGCYRLADGLYLMIALEKKDQKPWRVAIASADPCRRVEAGPALEVRHRSGVTLGDNTPTIVEKMGRPDASAPPETASKKLGDMEYFYICRVSEGCARHTSVFIREGVVTAIAEWYSQ